MIEDPKPEALSTEPQSGYTMPYRSNVLAIMEGVVLLGGLALLDHFGVIDMRSWPVHPFLFVTVLMGAQYGIYGGIFAAMAAIVISYFDGWPIRPVSMSYFDFFRVAWAHPLTWIGSGIVIGLVTSRQRRTLSRQTELLKQSQAAERVIATQYEVLAVRARKLERRLAGLTENGEAPEIIDVPVETATPVEIATPVPQRPVARKSRASAAKPRTPDKNN